MTYHIITDEFGDNWWAYILVKQTDICAEVIASNVIYDKEIFDQEVDRLSKEYKINNLDENSSVIVRLGRLLEFAKYIRDYSKSPTGKITIEKVANYFNIE